MLMQGVLPLPPVLLLIPPYLRRELADVWSGWGGLGSWIAEWHLKLHTAAVAAAQKQPALHVCLPPAQCPALHRVLAMKPTTLMRQNPLASASAVLACTDQPFSLVHLQAIAGADVVAPQTA
jgi:hypothetical protein